MHRHGLSHAVGYLFCSLVSGVIVDMLKRYYPKFNIAITSVAGRFYSILEYRVSPKTLSVTIVACVLAFVWGVAYKISSRGR